MIPARLLHRLVSNIVDSATAIELEEGVTADEQAHLARLVEFGKAHALDTEDMATLFRVSACEMYEDPYIRRDSFADPGIIQRS